MDLVPGEEVLFTAHLRQNAWMRYRCVMCSMTCLSSFVTIPLMPFYMLFGGMCRRDEAESFELTVTNYNIHFSQKIYDCGICCQNTQHKIIPLEKIQDIVLMSNWCGDKCGFAERSGDVYQLHIQTAGQGGVLPELSIFCIENPREFKRMVLDAKQRTTSVSGQTKNPIHTAVQIDSYQQQERLIRVLEMLERQLEVMNTK
jgi:hypothetical protein